MTVNTIASFGDGAAATPSIAHKGDLNTGIWFPAADTIAASTAGTEKMRIEAGGNVGIGTTSPDALLTVNTIASFGDGAAATPSIAHKGDLNTGIWFPAADTISASTAGIERMRITSGGLVGIGTTSPDALLTVNTIASFADGAAATPSIAHKGDLNTGIWFPAADTISASTAGIERMRITSGGLVGIGTTPTTALLDVQSTTAGVRFPNMTTVQKNAIATPQAGTMVFDTTLAKLCVYSGAAWQTITSV